MVRKPRKGGLLIGGLWLFFGIVWVLQGGSFPVFAVITAVFLLGIFVMPVLERVIAGKELLSDVQDFQQERLLPLMEELKFYGVEVTLLESPPDEGGELTSLALFKTFESLAQIRLMSYEVDLIHIGYWTDMKFGMEVFYFDFAVECEIEEETRIHTELSITKRFILFGRRRFKWWGDELVQSLNQDEALKETLADVCKVMEMPALWVIPSAEGGLVRIHIPDVKRVDAKQFPSILAVAERIAQHIKSLA